MFDTFGTRLAAIRKARGFASTRHLLEATKSGRSGDEVDRTGCAHQPVPVLRVDPVRGLIDDVTSAR